MSLGKEIRLARLFNSKSSRLLAITLDHPLTRGVLPGIIDIHQTMEQVIAGKPDAVTLHKGIAQKIFPAYVGKAALIMKSTAYSTDYHPYHDTPVADVEDALRLGADAISVGLIVGGPEQAPQLTHLGSISKEADMMGMPLVAHIYPQGSLIKNPKDEKALAYAVRAGAELGVDIIKTHWSGSAETFQRVIEACPAKVCLSGGAGGNSLREYLNVTSDALAVGLAGVTYGRFVWQDKKPAAVIRALAALMHEGASVEDALLVYEQVN